MFSNTDTDLLSSTQTYFDYYFMFYNDENFTRALLFDDWYAALLREIVC